MTKNTNTKKKSSASKKLIPAIGMLTVSAMMLSTATYAWFTMSREVEVSNIQMSATVPEDIQISLGAISNPAGTAISPNETTASLANGLGLLWKGSENGATADNGNVVPPTNEWDWSNIADISEYYQFGKLIPASSTTGANIFFTPNANGVGKTITEGAAFYQANSNSAILTAAEQSTVSNNNSDTAVLSATAHAITAKSGGKVTDKWSTSENGQGNANYKTSAGWNDTNDDGYYIDIPVWLRTSSTDGADLSVQAYVKPVNNVMPYYTNADETLYRAVRVAIIDVADGTKSDGAEYYNTYAVDQASAKGLLPIADGYDKTANNNAGGIKTNPFSLSDGAGTPTYSLDNSILDWYGRKVSDGGSNATKLKVSNATGNVTGDYLPAVNSVDASTHAPTYTAVTVYNPAAAASATPNNVVATLAAPTKTNTGVKTTNYGAPHKIVVRIWLEGEDPDCWNETAGQDWSINLKFNNEKTNPITDLNQLADDVPGVNKDEAPVPAGNGG